jgi:hypothetical protein
MGSLDFNTILSSSGLSRRRTEIRVDSNLCCEAVTKNLTVTFDLNSEEHREKFGMCEDLLIQTSNPGLILASKGSEESPVAWTENPVVSRRRFRWILQS